VITINNNLSGEALSPYFQVHGDEYAYVNIHTYGLFSKKCKK
jgi:hypothetical protein